MKCPTCGFEQPDSRIDCEYCGLVFAKWKAKREAAQKAVEAKSPETTPKVVELKPPEAAPPSLILNPELKDQTIPDKPGPALGPFPNAKRIFEILGSLSLQRNSGGIWMYFPWGTLGPGYAVTDPAILGLIQRLETIFSLFQVSFVSSLCLAACSAFIYKTGKGDSWFCFLALFFVLAYGLFIYHSGRLTGDLPLTRRRFNNKQYLLRLFSCFAPASLLGLESVTLMSALAGIWAVSSNRLFVMGGKSAGFLVWLWVGLSLGGFALSSYLFYFRKSGPP